jgi:hypothetical protein
MRDSRVVKVGLALLFPVFVLVLYQSTSSYLGDTDRFYHFALSRMLAEKGAFMLEALPQAEDVGWGGYFPDKEFLFHLLTRIGYSLGAETGVVAVCLALASAMGISLYFFAALFLSPVPAFLCASSFFFAHSLVFRLLLVRPHVAALLCFVLLNIAILRRRPLLASLAAAGYAMAYHAFYIPLACLAVALVCCFLESKAERAGRLKAVALAFVGILAGLLLNPYFPSQVHMGLLHAKIPFLIGKGMRELRFGLELYPLGAPGMLKFYYLPFATLLLAASRYAPSFSHRYLFTLSGLFGLLAFQTVRAGEYFIPVTAMLFPLAISTGKQTKRKVRWALSSLAVFQLVVLVYIARTEASFVPDEELYDHTRRAIALIPPGPAKVFNCEWDAAPFLFHARPDLRFVDLLDPSFLHTKNPQLSGEKIQLHAGKRANAYGILGTLFRADYVLCRDPRLLSQMATDPGFQRIYPVSGSSPVQLFRRASAAPAAFVRHFSLGAIAVGNAAEAREIRPGGGEELRELSLPEGSVALELGVSGPDAIQCVMARPSSAEVQRLVGARYLGLGGGQAIRAWRNGKLLFASGPGYSQARSVQALARLEPALSRNDRLEILACSDRGSGFLSLALSLWAEDRAAAVCAWKRELTEKEHEHSSRAPFSSDNDTCIGSLVGASVPWELRR